MQPVYPQQYYYPQQYEQEERGDDQEEHAEPQSYTFAPPPMYRTQPPFNGNQDGQMLPIEQSYIENILRLNSGKEATVYMTFGSGTNQQVQVFEGVIQEAGRDHIILHDTSTGQHYLLLMVYLDYIVFNEPIEYEYPFGGANMGTYSLDNPFIPKVNRPWVFLTQSVCFDRFKFHSVCFIEGELAHNSLKRGQRDASITTT